MFSFLKNKTPQVQKPFLLAFMESDWHCHLLPGIDDGADSEIKSLQMLEMYVELGIKKIVATPHVMADYYKNTQESILNAQKKVQALIDQHQFPLRLEAAAEYYADEHFLRLIEDGQVLSIENQYVLFEFSMQSPPIWSDKLIEKLQQKGHTPLLAHPERYRYWHGKPQMWERLKNQGVCFQLNLLSLLGYYGSGERHAALQMLDRNYFDALGSDAHSVQHLRKLNELASNQYFDQLQQLPLLNRLG